jgi:hypothetical protein
MPVLWCWLMGGEIFHTRCLLERLEAAGWQDTDLSEEVAHEQRPMDRLADLIDTRIEAGLLAEEDAPRHLDHSPDEALTIVAANGFKCAACGIQDSPWDPLE